MNSLTVSLPNPECELLLLRKIPLQLGELAFSSANRRLSGNKNKFCFEIKFYSKKALISEAPQKKALALLFLSAAPCHGICF